jgi:hypothetical protein
MEVEPSVDTLCFPEEKQPVNVIELSITRSKIMEQLLRIAHLTDSLRLSKKASGLFRQPS